MAGYSASNINTTLLSGLAYLHKPDRREKLINSYPEQYGLEWFVGFDWMKEATTREQYNWTENDFFVASPVIGSVAVSGSTVIVTLGVGSYSNAGANSAGRVGEVAFLPNGLQGYVSAKDETTANAHTITLTPLGFQSDGVTAVTAAQLAANIVVGSNFALYSNMFGEGSFGQTKTNVTGVNDFSNYLQNLSDDYKITFDELTEGTWVTFEGPGGAGKYYYHKGMKDTEANIERAIMGTLFMGTGGTVAGAGTDAGKTVRATEGFYTTADLRGSKLPYTVIGKTYFENIERIFRKNYSGSVADCMVGPEWINAAQDYLVEYKKDRPDGAASSVINTTFSQATIGTTNYNILPLGILKDPRFLGVAANRKFSGLNMIIPSTRGEGSLITMRYKDQQGGKASKGRSWYAMESFGFRGDTPNSTEDVKEIHYKIKIGAEFHRASESILSHPM